MVLSQFPKSLPARADESRTTHLPVTPVAEDAETGTDRAGFGRVFISTFGAIFLAELGDKTQLATLLMSAESGKPWMVFMGAGTALVLTSLLGVALGQWMARRVSAHALDTAAGVILLAITVWLLWDVVAT